ncbi:hypothetical protein IQ62_44355 [Streptomyces scabiei]|nr:hypothetical protein IQ62_44355 [Streptomyces scabiei]
MERVLQHLMSRFQWLLSGETGSTEQKLREVERRLGEQEKLLEEFRQTLDTVRSSMNRLQDDQFVRHEQLSKKWLMLLDGRELKMLVEQAVERSLSVSVGQSASADRTRPEAQLLRDCVDVLVAGEGVNRAKLERLLLPSGPESVSQRRAVVQLCDKAEALHREASHLRKRPEFDFDLPAAATPGSVILYSPECGYGQEPALVVLPAYRLGDKRLSLPYVMTTPRSGPPAGYPSATTQAARDATSGQGPV